MANLISFPFRLGPNGAVVTQPEDSPEYYAELLATMLLTKPGERPQVPIYGLNDPTFAEVDPQEVAYKVELFGPPVEIVGVKSQYVSNNQQDVQIEFKPLDADETDTPNFESV